MTDLTLAAARIRAAIERCIDASPAPTTTDDIAAAVLQEAAVVLFPEEPHPTELQRSTTAKGTAIDRAIDEAWDWSAWLNRKRANKILQALAQQLNGTDPIRGVPPLLAARDALAAVPTDGPAVQGREPASVAPEAIEPTAAQSICQAVEAVFARSPVPPTTNEVVAVVLRAALPHVLPLREDTPWELLLVRGRLLDIATELDSAND